jgi:hypothetical protein
MYGMRLTPALVAVSMMLCTSGGNRAPSDGYQRSSRSACAILSHSKASYPHQSVSSCESETLEFCPSYKMCVTPMRAFMLIMRSYSARCVALELSI